MHSALCVHQLAQKILEAADHHSTLLVPAAASFSQAKAAYRQIALRLHPDKTSCPLAPEAFKKATDAVVALQETERSTRAACGWQSDVDAIYTTAAARTGQSFVPLGPPATTVQSARAAWAGLGTLPNLRKKQAARGKLAAQADSKARSAEVPWQDTGSKASDTAELQHIFELTCQGEQRVAARQQGFNLTNAQDRWHTARTPVAGVAPGSICLSGNDNESAECSTVGPASKPGSVEQEIHNKTPALAGSATAPDGHVAHQAAARRWAAAGRLTVLSLVDRKQRCTAVLASCSEDDEIPDPSDTDSDGSGSATNAAEHLRQGKAGHECLASGKRGLALSTSRAKQTQPPLRRIGKRLCKHK